MKDYRLYSKITLGLCVLMIILSIVNYFTGFINKNMEKSGTLIVVTALVVAIVAIVYAEKGRKDNSKIYNSEIDKSEK